MRTSRTITLFSDRPDPFVSGSSFAVSILMHGAVIGVVGLAILYGPQNPLIITEHYSVRHLELHAPDTQTRTFSARGAVEAQVSSAIYEMGAASSVLPLICLGAAFTRWRRTR